MIERLIAELHLAGWSVGITAFDGFHHVSCQRDGDWIQAVGETEVEAWEEAARKAASAVIQQGCSYAGQGREEVVN